MSSDGFVKTMRIVRPATATATPSTLTTVPSARGAPSPRAPGAERQSVIAPANPKPSASAWPSQPVMIRLRTHSSRYDTGFAVASDPEPRHVDQVAGNRHRRDEQKNEEEWEHALNGLAGAGSQRDERAEAAEAERDEERERKQDERTEPARRQLDSRGEPDGEKNSGLDEAQSDDAGQTGPPAPRSPASASATSG